MNNDPTMHEPDHRRGRGDRGSMMPMAIIFVSFLLISTGALVSASQAWGERRQAQATAAAAARAASQPSVDEIVNGVIVLDPVLAEARAQIVLSDAGFTGPVNVSADSVTVTATGTVSYAFGAPPGFPPSMTATATADVANQVLGG